MADRTRLAKKDAVDHLIEQEVAELRKSHPELSAADCYSEVFRENPVLYSTYVQLTSVPSQSGDE